MAGIHKHDKYSVALIAGNVTETTLICSHESTYTI